MNDEIKQAKKVSAECFTKSAQLCSSQLLLLSAMLHFSRLKFCCRLANAAADG